MSHRSSTSRARWTLRRLALFGATWLAGFALPRRDVVVQVSAASDTATLESPDDAQPEAPPPVRSWRAAAVRTLGSDHYSFRAAVRRLRSSATGACADRELLVANGYDHAPQYLARIAFRGRRPHAHRQRTRRRRR